MRIHHVILVLFAVSLLNACKKSATNTTATTSTDKVAQLKVPRFVKDSAYQYVVDQVNMGPRVPGLPGHTQTRAYLVNKLKAYGAQVKEQELDLKRYDGEPLQGANIIASFNPDIKKRVVISAHWDTRFVGDKETDAVKAKLPIDGADDGASGTAVALEIARLLGENPLNDLGVDIVLFDLEDQGADGSSYPHSYALGSQYWSKNIPSGYKPRWGILLDMVGAENARFPRERYSYENARFIHDKVWKLAQKMGHGNIFVDDVAFPVGDDHYYVMRDAKIPMIDIINLPPSGGFGDYHHTHDDNIDLIDKNILGAVGQVVTAAIYRYNNGTL